MSLCKCEWERKPPRCCNCQICSPWKHRGPPDAPLWGFLDYRLGQAESVMSILQCQQQPFPHQELVLVSSWNLQRYQHQGVLVHPNQYKEPGILRIHSHAPPICGLPFRQQKSLTMDSSCLSVRKFFLSNAFFPFQVSWCSFSRWNYPKRYDLQLHRDANSEHRGQHMRWLKAENPVPWQLNTPSPRHRMIIG